jgi:hypothetical protein
VCKIRIESPEEKEDTVRGRISDLISEHGMVNFEFGERSACGKGYRDNKYMKHGTREEERNA